MALYWAAGWPHSGRATVNRRLLLPESKMAMRSLLTLPPLGCILLSGFIEPIKLVVKLDFSVYFKVFMLHSNLFCTKLMFCFALCIGAQFLLSSQTNGYSFGFLVFDYR